MTNRAAAMRYARALLEISQKDGDPERVERELSAFVRLMHGHARLNSSLVSPAVPPASKRALIDALTARAGDLSAITVRLLSLLADRDLLTLLSEILGVYRDRLMDLRGVVRATITTVSPLPEDRVQTFARNLETSTGKQVVLDTAVDPTVIGGAVAQIGSTVFDGSIARHLARLRQRFLSEA